MIHYRLATQDDNDQLLELTSASGMTGEIALRIDRHPDFFQLLKLRGESKVFVAVDGSSIVGSLAVSEQQVFLGGEIHSLLYIGDFKVAEAYRNKSIGGQLCDELAKYVISIDADLAFLNVSKGNDKPFSFFRNRPGFPDFNNIGVFNIHQLVGKKQKNKWLSYVVESTTASFKVIDFLNSQYSSYELGSVITKGKLEGTDLFIIQHENKIIAAMCLADTMSVKQNVMTQLSWMKKIMLRAMNLCSGILGISKMPTLQMPVRMLYIKYLAVRYHDRKLVLALINHARHIAYERSYSFASISLHEKDPLNASLAGHFRLTFKSIGMLISLKNHKRLIEQVTSGIPFEDYSLV